MSWLLLHFVPASIKTSSIKKALTALRGMRGKWITSLATVRGFNNEKSGDFMLGLFT
jgi:hypothetical protein